tara:strand:- start:2149 stop:2607 length:459 start_codon:yes stop_codon:yes gene_type:complete
MNTNKDFLEITQTQFEKLTSLLERDHYGYYLPFDVSTLNYSSKGEIPGFELIKFSEKLNKVLEILNLSSTNEFNFKTMPSIYNEGEECLNLYILTDKIVEASYIYYDKLLGLCQVSDFSNNEKSFRIVQVGNTGKEANINTENFNVYNYRII